MDEFATKHLSPFRSMIPRFLSKDITAFLSARIFMRTDNQWVILLMLAFEG